MLIKAPTSVFVKDENDKPLHIEGQIRLRVRLGTTEELIKFYVAQILLNTMILGFEFFDKHVKAMRPCARTVELDDGTTIPILLKPSF